MGYRRFIHNCCITLLLLALLGSGLEGYAQLINAKGHVATAEGEAIPFASVYIEGSERGVSADLEGNFQLFKLQAGDSITASAVGFHDQTFVAITGKTSYQFRLTPANVVLESVLVRSNDTAQRETGKPLIRRVIDAKKQNDFREIPNYRCEVYNKMEVDLIGEDLLDRAVLRKIDALQEATDIIKTEQLLPALLSESLSDYVYRSKPAGSKEFVKATRVSGMDAESFAPFLGQLHQEFSIYDNWMGLLGQNFVSPIADAGTTYYKYYLADSNETAEGMVYTLQFTPRRDYENAFYGSLVIDGNTLAVSELEMQLADGGNINFVNHIAIRQTYEQHEGQWMRGREQMVVRFHGLGRKTGVIGRKTTSYKGYQLNKVQQDGLFEEGRRSTVYEDAGVKTDAFWRSARHEALNEREVKANTLSERLEEDPTFRTWADMLKFLFVGYQQAGPLEFGPYFKLVGRNAVEGWRFRLGARTSKKFSEKVRLHGYAAYGLLDKQWKMGGGLLWIPDKHNWQEIGLKAQDDILTGSLVGDQLSEDNLLTGLYRRNAAPAQKLMRQRYATLWYQRDWTTGFSSRFELRRQELTPYFPLYYPSESGDPSRVDSAVIRNEAAVGIRFARGEKHLKRTFSRISLGADGATWQLRYAYGIDGPSRLSFPYHRIELGVSDKFPIHPIGQFEYSIQAGKIFGELPMLLLEVHRGNETWFYSDNAFSLMNQYEFVSDAWTSVFVTHHFDGYILGRLPLIRKLQWRSLISAKATYGMLSHANQQMISETAAPWYVLGDIANPLPYVEAGIGIENIFRLLRVDAIWRLTYLDNPAVQPFGVRLGMEFQF